MGYIKHLKDKPGGKKRNLPWRVYIHHKELGWTYSKCFAVKNEADIWEAEQEQNYRMRDTQEFNKISEHKRLRNEKASSLVQKYIDGGYIDEDDDDIYYLNAFCRSAMGSLPLADLKKPQAITYFKERQKETYSRKGWQTEKPVTARAVSRERNRLQRVWETAIDEWEGYSTLVNPFRGLKIEGSTHRSRRTLREGEEEKLAEHFKGCLGLNKYYVPLAMYLALDTGMRMQEILNLKWSDIDFEQRRIEIRKSKTDRKQVAKGGRAGRRIVLPYMAMSSLIDLAHSIHTKGQLPGYVRRGAQREKTVAVPHIKSPIANPDTPVFLNRNGRRMTPEALTQIWADLVKRAGIEPYNGEALTFRCLRRAATVKFIQAKLEKDERDIMLGHADKSMDRVYWDDELALEEFLIPIQDKLDRHVLGMTLEEAVEVTEGRKITTKELAKMGSVPIAIMTRLRQVLMGMPSFLNPKYQKEGLADLPRMRESARRHSARGFNKRLKEADEGAKKRD